MIYPLRAALRLHFAGSADLRFLISLAAGEKPSFQQVHLMKIWDQAQIDMFIGAPVPIGMRTEIIFRRTSDGSRSPSSAAFDDWRTAGDVPIPVAIVPRY